jgi:hypothetical protein
VTDLSAPPTFTRRVESRLDSLLDAAAATGARLTWGRTRFTGRHWVAVELLDGRIRVRRRGRTREEAARRLFYDVYREF